jgi:hypothetical protein
MATGANLFADEKREARLIAALIEDPAILPAIEAELLPDAITTPALQSAYRALLRGASVSERITTEPPSEQPLEDARVLERVACSLTA